MNCCDKLRPDLCCGFTKTVCDLLQKQSVKTVLDFITTYDIETLARKSGIEYKELSFLRKNLVCKITAIPLNGLDIYEDMLTTLAILSTGSQCLDDILSGGIFTGEITEICGVSASGKTQICFGFASSVATSVFQNVLYIDTTCSFTADRIFQIMTSRSQNSLTKDELTAALNRIRVVQIFGLDELLQILKQVHELHEEDEFFGSVKAVIIDSVTAVVIGLLGGKQVQGHCNMMQLSRELKTLCTEHSVAVLITNTMVPSDTSRPSMGNAWSHVPNTRLLLSVHEQAGTTSFSSPTRHATLLKCSRMPVPKFIAFHITDSGIQEAASV